MCDSSSSQRFPTLPADTIWAPIGQHTRGMNLARLEEWAAYCTLSLSGTDHHQFAELRWRVQIVHPAPGLFVDAEAGGQHNTGRSGFAKCHCQGCLHRSVCGHRDKILARLANAGFRDRFRVVDTDCKELAGVEKKIEGIVVAIQDGAYSPALKEKLHELEARKEELTKRLATVPPEILDIHPNVAGVYRRKVVRLAKALSKPEERDAAAAAIRGLIDGIVLTVAAAVWHARRAAQRYNHRIRIRAYPDQSSASPAAVCQAGSLRDTGFPATLRLATGGAVGAVVERCRGQLAQSILEDGKAKPHFMGAVVLQQTRFPTGTIERRIVVDGQQRLTTLQLLIDAIQEVLEGREHTDPAKRLATLVLNQEEFRDGNPDNAFKVWPTVVDRVAFRHAMSNDLSAAGHTASRIVQAHEFFKGQAEQWLDRFPAEESNRVTRPPRPWKTRCGCSLSSW